MKYHSLPTYPGPSANAQKNGFDALDYIYLSRLEPYERGILDELREALYQQYDPHDLLESLIVDRIAMNHFRLMRMYLIEHHSFEISLKYPTHDQESLPNLDRFSRYDSRLSHQLSSLHQTFLKARKSRELTHQLSQDPSLSS